ncbi:TPA: hypothetical protein OMI73_000526 [Klebsiella pneumoniae]|uniref:hypothetical protein n=1 Tax=Klebsiella pneumoniae TaxID=573 RepID=UPI0019183268|nr:hypothetical protein [Klebsiella pneumoniae]EKZ9794960.1 hypothetical protein [Klebsiella pneumoniae]MCP5932503.1 hypothetical protein [Klebsiella pneumoniae]MCU6562449.1 hypothetical protein [Klebsiella pneumoniae]MDF9953424.1 hypothetical protein [Klebsiella pneumoniae]UZI69224.1 hypothetical protein JMW14_09040 [Klebsiella pneumoniae]
MKNEVEQIALQNDMSIEFVTWFFNEKKAGCGNVWFMMMAAMWEGWKGRSIEMDKLAAENVALKESRNNLAEFIHEELDADYPLNMNLETHATDRIVAGIKAEAKSHDLNAFISHYSAELDNHIANGGDQFDERAVRLRSVIVGARMFREKLRDEEKALALREGADK